jgi:hypothetical protein
MQLDYKLPVSFHFPALAQRAGAKRGPPSAKLALRIARPEVSGSHRGVALWREEQES